MLQLQNWTHKASINYSQLVNSTDDLTLDVQITQKYGGGNYAIRTGTAYQLKGWRATVISGTGVGQTASVNTYVPSSTNIYFSPDFGPTDLDGSSIIRFTESFSYKDLFLLGIPANHIITGVKINTLSSFETDAFAHSIWLYIGNDAVFPTPTNAGDSLVHIVNNTYGMGCLTIPPGNDDSYEYGSFRWFTFSGPGGPTYAKNQLVGNPTIGSYCLPQRLDAHDVIARFCILSDTTNTPANPALLGVSHSFNHNVTAGDVEISVQYASI